MSHQWTDDDSIKFLNFADIITPSRAEQMRTLAGLIPAAPDESFQIVELGCGGGELAAVLLDRFTNAHYLGLDGSPAMLQSAHDRLTRFQERVELRPFQLEDTAWLDSLPKSARCFVSSLVVHHLDDPGKIALVQALHDRLDAGGALLLSDIILPTFPLAQSVVGAAWDEIVREQSMTMTGSDEVFQEFKQGGWNCYSHPDPMDKPASLFDQLRWLEEAGFSGVDCFWQRAGHAVFGGYRVG